MGDLDFFCPLFVTMFDIFLIWNICCFAPYQTIVNLILKKSYTLSNGRKETIKEIEMNKFGAKVNNDGEDSPGFQMTCFHDKQTLLLMLYQVMV